MNTPMINLSASKPLLRIGLLILGTACALQTHAQSLSVVPGTVILGKEGRDAVMEVTVLYKGPVKSTQVRAKINGAGADIVTPAGGSLTLVDNHTYPLKAKRHISGDKAAKNGEFNLRGFPVVKLP